MNHLYFKRGTIFTALLIVTLHFIFSCIACKTTKEPALDKIHQNTDSVEFFTPEISKYGKDSIGCIRNLTYYHDYLSRNNITAAINPWRKAFTECPASSQNLYIDGITIIKFMFNNTSDNNLQEKYIDTLMLIYDKRITYFGNEGYILGRKGIDIITYRPSDYKTAYECLNKSVEIEGKASRAAVLPSLFSVSLKMLELGELDTTKIFNIFENISEIIIWNKENNLLDSALYHQSENEIEKMFYYFAPCSGLQTFYSEQTDQITNTDKLSKIISAFEFTKCTDNEVYSTFVKKYYSLKKCAHSAFSMGIISFRDNQYIDAENYFVQAAYMFENKNKKAAAYRAAGEASKESGRFEAARTYAYKSLNYDSKSGRAYVLIGDLYAASSTFCNDDEIMKNAVYWAATDKYQKAIEIEPALVYEVLPKIEYCKSMYPETKEIFFKNLKEGESYNVGCWIQEITTIQTLKDQ